MLSVESGAAAPYVWPMPKPPPSREQSSISRNRSDRTEHRDNADLDSATERRRSGEPLAHVETWVFDMDNTLYPADSGLFLQVQRRMGEWIAQAFNESLEAARARQKDYFLRHGTTLVGLMREHGLPPGPFLDYVHDIDLSVLQQDGALARCLDALPGRKVIFTNASARHAENIAAHLGIDHHFDAIFDIHDANYIPKPEEPTYDRLIGRLGLAPARCCYFEDMPQNLEPAAARGMTTVLIRGSDRQLKQTWQETAPHIHHVTDDLCGFLDAVRAARETGPGNGNTDTR